MYRNSAYPLDSVVVETSHSSYFSVPLITNSSTEVPLVADVMDISKLGGSTPARDRRLFLGSLHGNVSAVRHTLEDSADPNSANRSGFGPLHAAAFGGHVKVK
jgi:hypothetical protein